MGLPLSVIFREHVLHVPGREELPLLHVDDRAGLCRSHKQVRLPAKECRDLQYVRMRRDQRALLFGMHIGEDRQAEFPAQIVEYRHGRFEASAAPARKAGAVGLVVARLVDETDAEFRREFLQRSRDVESVLAALELARPRDQRKRTEIGKADTARDDRFVRIYHFTASNA